MSRRLLLERPVADFVRALAPARKRQVRSAFDGLRRDWTGRRGGLDVKELEVDPDDGPLYRLAVGDLRFAFLVDDAAIRIFHAFPRRQGYGWLARIRDVAPARSK